MALGAASSIAHPVPSLCFPSRGLTAPSRGSDRNLMGHPHPTAPASCPDESTTHFSAPHLHPLLCEPPLELPIPAPNGRLLQHVLHSVATTTASRHKTRQMTSIPPAPPCSQDGDHAPQGRERGLPLPTSHLPRCPLSPTLPSSSAPSWATSPPGRAVPFCPGPSSHHSAQSTLTHPQAVPTITASREPSLTSPTSQILPKFSQHPSLPFEVCISVGRMGAQQVGLGACT